MKLSIYLTEEMACALVSVAKAARRYPRQQAEYLLEVALCGQPKPSTDKTYWSNEDQSGLQGDAREPLPTP